MGRRAIYITTIVVFIPVIVWYAGTFSDMPVVTFKGARAITDSVGEAKKVLVPGQLAPDHEVSAGEGGLTFFLQDDSGAVKRVVYDGSGTVTPEELTETREKGGTVKVAGHICNDGQGERFHAKNVYISN